MLCLPECLWFLMESKKLSLSVRYFWLHVVSCVSKYLRKITKRIVQEATSVKSKDRRKNTLPLMQGSSSYKLKVMTAAAVK